MKVSIIGGGGLVGSMTAFVLQTAGIVSDICLIDANKEMALGQATDLLHGASLAADQRISAGDMGDVSTSDVVVVTAGLRRKPDESRLDLINRNVDLFLGLLEQAKAAGFKEDSYLLIVSNPVDVLTYLTVERSGLPWQRIIGLGTQLDTARFRSYLARTIAGSADPSASTDPGRTWRQHGADLVECNGSRVAYGADGGIYACASEGSV